MGDSPCGRAFSSQPTQVRRKREKTTTDATDAEQTFQIAPRAMLHDDAEVDRVRLPLASALRATVRNPSTINEPLRQNRRTNTLSKKIAI